MTEQEEFFSQKDRQLLKIALWAKYLAWIALGIHIFFGISGIIQKQGFYEMIAISNSLQGGFDYWDMVRQDPLFYVLDIGIDVANAILKGFIYFVFLKAVSLGLSAIVEANNSYRDKNVPLQNDPVLANDDDEDDGLDEWESKLLDDENQPQLYDPLEVLALIDNIHTVAKAVVIVKLLVWGIGTQFFQALLTFGSTSFVDNVDGLFSDMFLRLLVISVDIAIVYFPLKATVYFLRILMETEFNSRKAT